MSHSPDEDRDAHLLAALRHAPDRDVKPPADVSAAILGRAQAAVQPPRADGAKWARWRTTFDRLLRPAPMAAFGTVAMATLIGVMWSGQSPPDATPSLRPETMAAAPPAVSIAAPAAADAPPAAPSHSIQQPTAPMARTSPPVARPQPPAAAGALQSKRGTTAEVAVTERSPIQPQPAAPAPRLAAAPRQTEAREPEAVRDAAAKSMADAAPAARSRAELPAAALGAAAPAAASPLTAANVDLEAAVRSDPARVRWRLASGRMAAHDATQRDWWSALARATQGRWQAAGAGAGATTDAQVTLTIDGVPRGSLVFEPGGVVWREPGGPTWRAPIAADTLREWQEALARW